MHTKSYSKGKSERKNSNKRLYFLFRIAGTSYPANFEMLFIYSAFIKGDHTYFDIEPPSGVNGTELYPHLKYTTISEFLDTLV